MEFGGSSGLYNETSFLSCLFISYELGLLSTGLLNHLLYRGKG